MATREEVRRAVKLVLSKRVQRQEEIREGIAIKLSIYACEAAWSLLGSFRKQVYLDQALAIMEYANSQGVVIKVEGELSEPSWGCHMIDGAILADRINSKKAGYVAVESLIEEE